MAISPARHKGAAGEAGAIGGRSGNRDRSKKFLGRLSVSVIQKCTDESFLLCGVCRQLTLAMQKAVGFNHFYF
jgi:hypothetical protein